MTRLFLLLLAALVLCTQVQCGRKTKKLKNYAPPLSDESRLYVHLTQNYDHWNPDRAVIPTYNASAAKHVKFGLALIYFRYDEASEAATLHTWQRHLWNDPTLRWAAEDFSGISQLHVPVSQIWAPDIVLYNGLAPSVHLDKETLAVVSSDGTVLYIPRINHPVHCLSNATHVSCRLKFGSWTVDSFQLDLDFYDGQAEVDTSDFVQSNAYDLVENAAEKSWYYYVCCDEPRTAVTYSLVFEKMSSFWGGKK